ncbi:MAG: trypsin-like peptidase domain-containing protein [Chitinophagaceae bacterium]
MFNQKALFLPLLVILVTAGSIWGYRSHLSNTAINPAQPASAIFKNAAFKGNPQASPMVDFEKAASKAAAAVVHIKVVIGGDMANNNSGDEFFNDYQQGGAGSAQGQMASGSGVSVSADGYIVTNNHVVERASEVLVTLNNKKDYKAVVVGTDPSTDLAVIKIEAENLPYLSFANSDDVHLGEWVLAVGFPLNLETTVTSGIVSARFRNIGINGQNSHSPIESFIQTDAAVNPGNSGGALVNTDGDVIGINSAIASPTGSYAGYSYAIPSNLVKKVAGDIIKYGRSKRAYLGIMFGSDQMNEKQRMDNNVKEGEGVFVMDVTAGSAAADAGIQKGDFITGINSRKISGGNEMLEKISSLRPGDTVSITYQHNREEKTAAVILKGDDGNDRLDNIRDEN